MNNNCRQMNINNNCRLLRYDHQEPGETSSCIVSTRTTFAAMKIAQKTAYIVYIYLYILKVNTLGGI